MIFNQVLLNIFKIQAYNMKIQSLLHVIDSFFLLRFWAKTGDVAFVRNVVAP